jgi:hypothetical protein
MNQTPCGRSCCHWHHTHSYPATTGRCPASTPRPSSFANGKTDSRGFSSPLTELISGLPGAAFNLAGSTAGFAESRQIGTSTADETSSTTFAMAVTSSKFGSPTLTSSTSAPHATCHSASWRTKSRSLSRNAAASFFTAGRVDFFSDYHEGLVNPNRHIFLCIF